MSSIAYNPLIPEPGELSITLFIELTSKPDLMTWLPKLIGIERVLRLHLWGGEVVAAIPEEAHADQLTDDEVTASVHYLRFELSPEQAAAFEAGPVELVIDHPHYN